MLAKYPVCTPGLCQYRDSSCAKWDSAPSLYQLPLCMLRILVIACDIVFKSLVIRQAGSNLLELLSNVIF